MLRILFLFSLTDFAADQQLPTTGSAVSADDRNEQRESSGSSSAAAAAAAAVACPKPAGARGRHARAAGCLTAVARWPLQPPPPLLLPPARPLGCLAGRRRPATRPAKRPSRLQRAPCLPAGRLLDHARRLDSWTSELAADSWHQTLTVRRRRRWPPGLPLLPQEQQRGASDKTYASVSCSHVGMCLLLSTV